MKALFNKNLIPCKPPYWAQNGHAQTILGHLLPSPCLLSEGERKEVAFTGGDKTLIHHFKGHTKRVVYLFHGLGGFSHSTYMQRTARVALSLGHSVFMMNHRGCGEASAMAREPYHSGRAEDLSRVIELGRSLYPSSEHVAVGFSLSGNALLLLAAGQRAQCLPDAAIAVNAPINLADAARRLGEGFNRVYDFRFVRDLRKALKARSALEPTLKELQLSWKTKLFDFDELYTARFSGFQNRADYYKQCSARQFLPDIKIPTLLLTSKDDPFVGFEDFVEAKKSSFVKLHLEDFGGHMGYLTRQTTPLGTMRWLDYALSEYLA